MAPVSLFQNIPGATRQGVGQSPRTVRFAARFTGTCTRHALQRLFSAL